jgi:protein-tyrosine phosphatase
VIDLHAHVVPGVDDGPATLEEAVALATQAAVQGTRTIVATPHVDDQWDVTPEQVADGVRKVQDALDQRGVNLKLLTGAEVAIPRLGGLSDDTLRALCLGGSPYLLVESPLSPSAADPEPAIHELLERGLRVVLAHPERSPAFQRDPGQLRRLAGHGVLTSVTAGALTGRFGRTARAYAVTLLREGLAHGLASDAHNRDRRPPGLRGFLETVEEDVPGISARARWLTDEAPRAILAGMPPPAPPPLPQAAKGWKRLLQRR